MWKEQAAMLREFGCPKRKDFSLASLARVTQQVRAQATDQRRLINGFGHDQGWVVD